MIMLCCRADCDGHIEGAERRAAIETTSSRMVMAMNVELHDDADDHATANIEENRCPGQLEEQTTGNGK